MPLLDPTSASALKAELTATVDRYTTQPGTPTTPTNPTNPTNPAISYMVNEDFSGMKTTADFLAKYGHPSDPGYQDQLFELDTALLGHPVLKYNIRKDNPAAPHFEIVLPERGVRHLLLLWRAMFVKGFHIACPTVAGSGYKWPSGGWDGANGRCGGDFSNGGLFDSSIDVKTSAWERVDVRHAMAVGDLWTAGAWWLGAYEIDVTSPVLARTRFWMGPESTGPKLLKGTATNPADVVGTILNGWLEVPVPQTFPLDRIRLGENFNEKPDADLAHYLASVRIVNLTKNPNAIATLNLPTT